MKLVRFGPAGTERPGLVDARGRIRDLSAHVDDIAGKALSDEGLARIAALDPAALPLVEEGTRIGPCVGQVGQGGAALSRRGHAWPAALVRSVVASRQRNIVCGV